MMTGRRTPLGGIIGNREYLSLKVISGNQSLIQHSIWLAWPLLRIRCI